MTETFKQLERMLSSLQDKINMLQMTNEKVRGTCAEDIRVVRSGIESGDRGVYTLFVEAEMCVGIDVIIK